jgi:hypothetical protein
VGRVFDEGGARCDGFYLVVLDIKEKLRDRWRKFYEIKRNMNQPNRIAPTTMMRKRERAYRNRMVLSSLRIIARTIETRAA